MENKQIIKKVIDYIENNLDSRLNLDDIAKEAAYSKFHLNRVFLEYVGCWYKGQAIRVTKCRYYDSSASHIRGYERPASDIKIMSDYMQMNKQRLNQLLAKNTGRTIAEIERDTERDHFMTAEQAKAYGLIDAVILKR